MSFEQAILVLEAAILILEKQRAPDMGMLDKIIYNTRIDGLKFAIECLREVET